MTIMKLFGFKPGAVRPKRPDGWELYRRARNYAIYEIPDLDATVLRFLRGPSRLKIDIEAVRSLRKMSQSEKEDIRVLYELSRGG